MKYSCLTHFPMRNIRRTQIKQSRISRKFLENLELVGWCHFERYLNSMSVTRKHLETIYKALQNILLLIYNTLDQVENVWYINPLESYSKHTPL